MTDGTMRTHGMLDRIKRFLEAGGGGGGGTEAVSGGDEHLLAVAALMVEAARMDENFDEAERRAITRVLKERFGLGDAETQSLIGEAEKAQDEANQLLGFTRAIKHKFSHEERVQMVEMLWEIVYADGELSQYESNLMRRIGGLIYVSDRERGEARKRVLARREKNG